MKRINLTLSMILRSAVNRMRAGTWIINDRMKGTTILLINLAADIFLYEIGRDANTVNSL
jgi:hypothetical protein